MEEKFKIIDGILEKYLGDEQEVTLPEGVVAIGEGAFCGCDSIKKVFMPDTVESIGAEAFYNCVSLRSVKMSKGLKRIGEKAFFRCIMLGSLKIPNGVSEIGKYIIMGCDSLKTLTIPRSVTSIENLFFPHGSEFFSAFGKDAERIARFCYTYQPLNLKKLRIPKHLEGKIDVPTWCEVVFY